MIYPEIPLAQSILEICKAHHIQHIVISPGSRNAPLTIGFASDPYFKCYSIADERAAAFFGLGIAQQQNYPVALVCTSGSALLNYYPAVAEAFYSQIPLVVISADRPTSKIDIGDGQTIRQRNVYDNHIVYSANLSEEAGSENDTLITTALKKAVEAQGPVHINAPFEEPLYNTVDKLSIAVPEAALLHKAALPHLSIAAYQSTWEQSAKKLILVGVCAPNTLDQELIDFLAKDPSVVVLTETTSNLHHPHFVAHIDRFITPFTTDDFKNFQPDLLITFGGMVVSKRIKAFLRTYQPKHHWHLDPLRHYNTFGCLTAAIQTTPNIFFRKLREASLAATVPTNYQEQALQLMDLRDKAHRKFIETIPFSDMMVYEKIFKNLPKNSQLQISNSAGIRYAQLFNLDASIEMFCNRGTSGIDGSTSTAIGASVGSTRQTLLITGDISFFYDNNALWNNYIPKNFKIILLNNQGGGIFRILPGHKETPVFNTYFETTHQLTAEHLAKMHGFQYLVADKAETLDQQLDLLWKTNDQPCILEVHTPTTTNNEVLKSYFNNLI